MRQLLCSRDDALRLTRLDRATQQPLPLPDALLLVDMDEVADQRLRDRRGRALPKFGTGRSPCGGTLPVPFPVKGFGALDAIEKLRHAGDAWRRSRRKWTKAQASPARQPPGAL